jgi:hypothetical protein
VVGFQRVLHAQQKTQSQNAEHLFPTRLLGRSPGKSESEVHIGLKARATPIGHGLSVRCEPVRLGQCLNEHAHVIRVAIGNGSAA